MVVQSPVAYTTSIGIAVVSCAAYCVAARLRPGPWVLAAARGLGVLMVAGAVSSLVSPVILGDWSVRADLPLYVCDVAVWVAAAAFWWQTPILYELTYFWGLAGATLAVATPTYSAPFPEVGFMQYAVVHLGLVMAAVITVVALKQWPRPGAVARVFVATCLLTVVAGIVDAITGANYQYLRHPPGEATLLQVLGPWPWYVLSATGVGLVLLMALNAPFWWMRRAGQRAAARPDAGRESRPERDRSSRP